MKNIGHSAKMAVHVHTNQVYECVQTTDLYRTLALTLDVLQSSGM